MTAQRSTEDLVLPVRGVGRIVHRHDASVARSAVGLGVLAVAMTLLSFVLPALSYPAIILACAGFLPVLMLLALSRSRLFPATLPVQLTAKGLSIPWHRRQIQLSQTQIRSIALSQRGTSVFDTNENEWVLDLSETDGSSLLEHLDPGPEGPSVRFLSQNRALALAGFFLWMVLAGALAFVHQVLTLEPSLFPSAPTLGPLSSAATLITVLLCVILAMYIRPRTKVELGGDGIKIDRKFISHEEIEKVDFDGENLRLHRASGITKLWLPADATLRSAVLGRALNARGSEVTESLKVFDRNRETVAEWKARLQGLATRQAGYRSVKLRAAQIELSVLDPRAPIDRRIGAALALRTAQPEGWRVVVDQAAHATANPELSEVFERLGDDLLDDEALDEFTATSAADPQT